MMATRFVAGLLAIAGLVGSTAHAADMPWIAPKRTYHHLYRAAPYYVVNQGPLYSGPGITVGPLVWVNTDVRRNYPFVEMNWPAGAGTWPASRHRRHRHVILRRLGAADSAILSARAEALPDQETTGAVAAKLATIPQMVRARADLRMLGPDRNDIKHTQTRPARAKTDRPRQDSYSQVSEYAPVAARGWSGYGAVSGVGDDIQR